VSTLAELIELACVMEATARKPGNVHPGASFVDLHYEDFVNAAAAIGPIIAQATPDTIGATVLRAIEATQQQARSNINLGIVLLLTPLAAIPQGQSLAALLTVLRGTTQRDAADVYHAIRLAHPGGLGQVDNQDVAEEPTQTLLEVMQLAADRDLIAAQYAAEFSLVRTLARRMTEPPAPSPPSAGEWAGVRGRIDHTAFFTRKFPLSESMVAASNAAHAIDPLTLPLSPEDGGEGTNPDVPPMSGWEFLLFETFLELLAQHPDSLIVRKAGIEIAREVQRRAAVVIENQWPHHPAGWQAFHGLDGWLRADGHHRNPGTSADLIAAALFVALREGWLTPPTRDELRAHAAAIRQAPN
jgi:triphosphoribosyl-dephospho-CoA synthase